MIKFSNGCTERAKDLVVGVGPQPATPTDKSGFPIPAFVASAAFSTLFSTRLPNRYRPESGSIELAIGTCEANGVRQTCTTYEGDSGGGLFVRDDTRDELRLIGVVSKGVYYIGPQTKWNPKMSESMGSNETLFASDTNWVLAQIAGRVVSAEPPSEDLNKLFQPFLHPAK